MAMQSLKKAGLHIGNSLLGANPSNPDGHFEDIETVKLHDSWLKAAGTDWCCTKQPPVISPIDSKPGMQAIIDRLGADHTQWGMKDPRAALYLDEWFSRLNAPYAVLVYRHFASCASSLQRRQAAMLFTQPSNESDHIRFLVNLDVALKSWLVHNQAILRQLKAHPDRCVLVSQESQIAGANLPRLVKGKFPVNLKINADTGVDKTKTTSAKTFDLDTTPLKQELEDTWNNLQALSEAPARNYPLVQWITPIEDASEQALDTALEQLKKGWDALGVPSAP